MYPNIAEQLNMEEILTPDIESLSPICELDGREGVEFEFVINEEPHKFEMRGIHYKASDTLEYTVFGLWDITDKDKPLPAARAVYLTLTELDQLRLSISFDKVFEGVATIPYGEQFDTLIALDEVKDITDHKAFAIDPKYRGNDLGQLFYAATLYALNKKGYDELVIASDTTQKKKRAQFNTVQGDDVANPQPSYYTRYAQILETTESMEDILTVVGRQRKNEEVKISTKITPPQYHLLKEYLK